MYKQEIGKVILRVVFGLTFFIHGLSKFQDGISNTVGYFDSLGIPGFLAYVVATIELIGGIALIFGIGTRIISLLFALIMIGAIFTAKLSLGFLGNGQMAGYELDLLLLAISFFFIFADKSVLSLDQKLFNSTNN
ncbi:putative membrane protein YphA (DoxX/SURF4 family) [Lederbergia galactosidilyticus]|uniref:DoxX family protein n=1 Tax=Lederbergia galactosidilytica TaxID=217031 RepID=UPI001AEA3E63|nr:DoxX family protein [Lederbergia galactosidilytica]MBP1916579.1 putative membrane protein YphA (DoxX/SURF4 family) [Lederbergia galactosidilytica]